VDKVLSRVAETAKIAAAKKKADKQSSPTKNTPSTKGKLQAVVEISESVSVQKRASTRIAQAVANPPELVTQPVSLLSSFVRKKRKVHQTSAPRKAFKTATTPAPQKTASRENNQAKNPVPVFSTNLFSPATELRTVQYDSTKFYVRLEPFVESTEDSILHNKLHSYYEKLQTKSAGVGFASLTSSANFIQAKTSIFQVAAVNTSSPLLTNSEKEIMRATNLKNILIALLSLPTFPPADSDYVDDIVEVPKNTKLNATTDLPEYLQDLMDVLKLLCPYHKLVYSAVAVDESHEGEEADDDINGGTLRPFSVVICLVKSKDHKRGRVLILGAMGRHQDVMRPIRAVPNNYAFIYATPSTSLESSPTKHQRSTSYEEPPMSDANPRPDSASAASIESSSALFSVASQLFSSAVASDNTGTSFYDAAPADEDSLQIEAPLETLTAEKQLRAAPSSKKPRKAAVKAAKNHGSKEKLTRTLYGGVKVTEEEWGQFQRAIAAPLTLSDGSGSPITSAPTAKSLRRSQRGKPYNVAATDGPATDAAALQGTTGPSVSVSLSNENETSVVRKSTASAPTRRSQTKAKNTSPVPELPVGGTKTLRECCRAAFQTLSPGADPVEIIGRDVELNTISALITTALEDTAGKGIFLCGMSGVGKTITVEAALDALQKDRNWTDQFVVTRVTGTGVSSTFKYLAEHHKWRDNSIGWDESKAKNACMRHFVPSSAQTNRSNSKVYPHHILFLDEIDKAPKGATAALYEACTANNSRLIVIGLANDITFPSTLKLKEDDLPRTVIFPALAVPELKQILLSRCYGLMTDKAMEYLALKTKGNSTPYFYIMYVYIIYVFRGRCSTFSGSRLTSDSGNN
jgi:hypothetical protein